MRLLITLAAIALASACYGQNPWIVNTPSPAMIRHQVRKDAYERNKDLIDEAYAKERFQKLLEESAGYFQSDSIHRALDKVNDAFATGYESPGAFYIRGLCLFNLEFYKEGLADLKKAAMGGDKDFYNTYLEAKKWLKDNGIKVDED